ncbi:hypothetical protein BDZ97DRAFT_1918990 [Flammula alnicola]|nr:hypothetical protein BDZ97DRAFT_1918990 [Flammula alnicola]
MPEHRKGTGIKRGSDVHIDVTRRTTIYASEPICPYMRPLLTQSHHRSPDIEDETTNQQSKFDWLPRARIIDRSDVVVVEPAKLQTTPGQRTRKRHEEKLTIDDVPPLPISTGNEQRQMKRRKGSAQVTSPRDRSDVGFPVILFLRVGVLVVSLTSPIGIILVPANIIHPYAMAGNALNLRQQMSLGTGVHRGLNPRYQDIRPRDISKSALPSLGRISRRRVIQWEILRGLEIRLRRMGCAMWPHRYDSCDVGTFPNQKDKDGLGPAAALHSNASRQKNDLSLSMLLPRLRPDVSHARAPEFDIFEPQKDKDLAIGQVVAHFMHDYVYNDDSASLQEFGSATRMNAERRSRTMHDMEAEGFAELRLLPLSMKTMR